MGKRTVQEAVAEMSKTLGAALEWSQAHPGRTLRELGEEVQGAITRLRARLLEEAVAQQGTGKPAEKCSSGSRRSPRVGAHLDAPYWPTFRFPRAPFNGW